MQKDDQRWYYLERANQSLTLASRAVDPHIAGIHLELYEHYLHKAGQSPAPRPILRMVPRQA